MAWIELTDKRGRGSKLFRDDANPLKHSLDSQAGTAWHYRSDPDVEVYDNEVDLTPARVIAGGHDGWRVVNNGWHYFLGQPSGLADGFVGFGGRQGNRWLLFRLVRVGYLHWPTRAWEDIGGNPDYDRANLSQQTNETIINTTEQAIPVEAAATWSDIWNTPGGGALDVSWRADGNRLKEEITINQEARTWIAANRPPSTPASETYFSFVFRLGSAPDVNNIEMDLSYLPRWLKKGVLQDLEGDFDDDDGAEGITVQNALQEFLFFLPISEAYVDLDVGIEDEERVTIGLRKRIYKEGNNYYLLVGARASDLAGMPAGDLVFDPSIDEQVGASTDDAYQNAGGNANTSAVDGRYGTRNLGNSPDGANGHRFTTVAIDQGTTIDTGTYIEMKKDGNESNQSTGTWYGNDVDDAATFSSEDLTARTLTTATETCAEDISRTDGNWYKLPSGGEWQGIIQEIVNRGSWSSGNDLALIYVGENSVSYQSPKFQHYDNAAADAAKLHVEYTADDNVEVEVPAATVTLTGYAPTVAATANVEVEVPAATVTLTGYAPTVAATSNVEVEVPAATVTLTGYAPTVAATSNVEVEVPAATVTLTGYAPTVTISGNIEVEVPAATVTLTGYAPTVTATANVEVEVPAATVTLTGYAPTVTATANVEVEVPAATVTLTGYAPTVTVAGSVEVEVPAATVTLTGYAPGVVTFLPAGRYSPGHPDCIEGFTEGLKVKLEVDGNIKFVGWIANIRPSSGAFEYPTVEVEAHDWMGYLIDQEIGIIPVQQTQRADQALATALAKFPIQPDGKDFQTGLETFMLVFDTESPKSSMASFFQKMCRNELGMVYTTGDGYLRFEKRTKRDLAVSPSFTLDGTMTELDVSYERRNIWNIIQATISPVEASPLPDVQLWDLKVAEYFGGVIPSIAAGATLVLECPFTDPALNVGISAIDVVDPIEIVEFGSVADFESNNMITDLEISQEIGAYGTIVTMKNTHAATTGYINDLQIYGRALYRYGSRVIESRNQPSIDTGIGERRFRMRLEGIANADDARAITDLIRDRYSDPQITAKRISWLATVDGPTLSDAIEIDPSQRFTMIESATGINQDFFVNRVKYTLRGGHLWVEVLADPVRLDVPPAYIFLTGYVPTVAVS